MAQTVDQAGSGACRSYIKVQMQSIKNAPSWRAFSLCFDKHM